MFTDIRDTPSGSTVEADVCVIGGGPAGISVAREFADTSVRLVLLESGGRMPEEDGRGMYQVVAYPHPTLVVDPTRTWYLGGATNHWAGNCRPLDEADFETRDWIQHSGWPIRREELLPYYERAQALAGLSEFRWYDLDTSLPHLKHPPLGVDPAVLTTRIMQRCPIPAFAELHRQRLDESSNVRILLHGHALSLKLNADGDRVEAVEIAGCHGNRFRVEADVFVLAAGGVENARLLLCSKDLGRNGSANNDLVGRFFMEHWYVDIPLGGWGNGVDLTFHDEVQTVGGADVWAQLVASEELMRRERIPGLSVWFHRLPRTTPSVAAMRRIAASVLGRVRPEPLTDLQLLLSDPGEVVKYVLRMLTRRSSEGYFIRVQLEQTPNPENRIRLSPRQDRFGQQHPELVLALDEEERQGQIRALRIAADEIGLNGARVAKQTQLLLSAGRFGSFWHHMGTTRMSNDPGQGVVDANCLVHGVSNLYAAGGSVFPTGGTAAPTLTMLALALRLADHIQRGSAPAARREPTEDGIRLYDAEGVE